MTAIIYQGDARSLPLPDESVDAIVCDPPYNLSFMGREWDSHGSPASFQAWCGQWAAEALRVLKPGGHLLAFGGTRTWHRLTCAVEDAGFEIRDSIAWLYGSGFPKSLDVARAIDQHRGTGDHMDDLRSWLNDRRLEAGLSLKQVNDALGWASNGGGQASTWMTNPTSKGLPTWQQWCDLKTLLGFGDEMDPEISRLLEISAGDDRPIIGERRNGLGVGHGTVPIIQPGSTLMRGAATEEAAAWNGWGTALKPGYEPVAVARKPLAGTVAANVTVHGTGVLNIDVCRLDASRWPTNVALDDNTAAVLDEQSGRLVSGANPARRSSDKFRTAYGDFKGQQECEPVRGQDIGGASRFFPVFRYQAKAPDAERPVVDGVSHPTVKPLDLMRWLCRLVTPPGGLILDQFAGSGTTVEAAMLEGFDVIGVEWEPTYLPLIRARVDRATRRSQPGIAALAAAKPRPPLDGQLDLFAELGGVG